MDAPKTQFALVVECFEAKSEDGWVMTKAGDKKIVVEEPEGWVEATSADYRPGQPLPRDTKLWHTRAAVEKFAKRWRGHPWWTNPNGNFEILEVVPQHVTTVTVVGYEVKK